MISSKYDYSVYLRYRVFLNPAITVINISKVSLIQILNNILT